MYTFYVKQNNEFVLVAKANIKEPIQLLDKLKIDVTYNPIPLISGITYHLATVEIATAKKIIDRAQDCLSELKAQVQDGVEKLCYAVDDENGKRVNFTDCTKYSAIVYDAGFLAKEIQEFEHALTIAEYVAGLYECPIYMGDGVSFKIMTVREEKCW